MLYLKHNKRNSQKGIKAMKSLQNLTTQELVNIINNVAGMALVGREYKDTDELCDDAHDELDRRFAERGEYVRL